MFSSKRVRWIMATISDCLQIKDSLVEVRFWFFIKKGTNLSERKQQKDFRRLPQRWPAKVFRFLSDNRAFWGRKGELDPRRNVVVFDFGWERETEGQSSVLFASFRSPERKVEEKGEYPGVKWQRRDIRRNNPQYSASPKFDDGERFWAVSVCPDQQRVGRVRARKSGGVHFSDFKVRKGSERSYKIDAARPGFVQTRGGRKNNCREQPKH